MEDTQQISLKELLEKAVAAMECLQRLPALVMQSIVDDIEKDAPLHQMLGTLDYTSEAFAVQQLLLDLRRCGPMTKALPMHESDTIRTEFSLNIGRSDVVVFHIDGTASVIEVKDGSSGYRSVVAGIGQATMYACQLGKLHGSVASVRRVLAWSRIGDAKQDKLIRESCELAGVIPVLLPSRKSLLEWYKSFLHEQHKGLMLAMAKDGGFNSFDALVDEAVSATAQVNLLATEVIKRAKSSNQQVV